MTKSKTLPFTADSQAVEALKSIVERVERIHEERASLADDIAAIYAQAKADGYEVKALRHVIKRRTKDPEEYKRLADIAELYYQTVSGTGTEVATRARGGRDH